MDQYLAELHLLEGREAEAGAAFSRAGTMLEARLADDDDDQRIHAALGVVYAGLGRDEEARRHARRAVELVPMESDALSAPIPMIQLALTLTMLGDMDGALEQLDTVLSIPSPMSVAWLEADPRWDGLRDDAGYVELLAKHGGPAPH